MWYVHVYKIDVCMVIPTYPNTLALVRGGLRVVLIVECVLIIHIMYACMCHKLLCSLRDVLRQAHFLQ